MRARLSPEDFGRLHGHLTKSRLWTAYCLCVIYLDVGINIEQTVYTVFRSRLQASKNYYRKGKMATVAFKQFQGSRERERAESNSGRLSFTRSSEKLRESVRPKSLYVTIKALPATPTRGSIITLHWFSALESVVLSAAFFFKFWIIDLKNTNICACSNQTDDSDCSLKQFADPLVCVELSVVMGLVAFLKGLILTIENSKILPGCNPSQNLNASRIRNLRQVAIDHKPRIFSHLQYTSLSHICDDCPLLDYTHLNDVMRHGSVIEMKKLLMLQWRMQAWQCYNEWCQVRGSTLKTESNMYEHIGLEAGYYLRLDSHIVENTSYVLCMTENHQLIWRHSRTTLRHQTIKKSYDAPSTHSHPNFCLFEGKNAR